MDVLSWILNGSDFMVEVFEAQRFTEGFDNEGGAARRSGA